jgi:hypothetical protein
MVRYREPRTYPIIITIFGPPLDFHKLLQSNEFIASITVMRRSPWWESIIVVSLLM